MYLKAFEYCSIPDEETVSLDCLAADQIPFSNDYNSHEKALYCIVLYTFYLYTLARHKVNENAYFQRGVCMVHHK